MHTRILQSVFCMLGIDSTAKVGRLSRNLTACKIQVRSPSEAIEWLSCDDSVLVFAWFEIFAAAWFRISAGTATLKRSSATSWSFRLEVYLCEHAVHPSNDPQKSFSFTFHNTSCADFYPKDFSVKSIPILLGTFYILATVRRGSLRALLPKRSIK